MKSVFFAVSAIFSAAAVDCSAATPWKAQIYPAAKTEVHHGNHLWNNAYYAVAGDTPAKSAVWADKGECDQDSAGSGSEAYIDCSDARPYKPNKIYPIPTVVHFQDRKFMNTYYANGADVPGSSAPWKDLGACVPGTAGPGPAGPQVDCTGVHEWTPFYVYDGQKAKAHFKHVLYEATSWTSGDAPDDADQWNELGDCMSGTDSTGQYPNPNEINAAAAALLCSCCRDCAKIVSDQPVCTEAVQDKCYFTWCGDYNTYDEEMCAKVKEDNMLSWYLGDLAEGKKEWPKHFYMPYIDGGLATHPKLSELATDIGVNHFVIAFVFTDTTSTECKGSFAGVIPVRQGPFSWNAAVQGNDFLYAEVNKLRLMGGDITVSFGGANGVELADSPKCQYADAAQALKKAYMEVIDAVKLTVIDFDIEGNAIGVAQRYKGWKNRFEAVKLLSADLPDLKVIWTLPILPSGLTLDGISFINDMMTSGARFDYLNVMTMDYGDDIICPGNRMHDCEVSAITNLAQQMFSTASSLGLSSKYGWNKPEDVYPMLGSTPMLGMNDLTHEVYTLENAHSSLKTWQTEKPIGIISNWSVTRDAPCSHSYVSVECSSINVQTEQYEFAKIFAPYTSA